LHRARNVDHEQLRRRRLRRGTHRRDNGRRGAGVAAEVPNEEHEQDSNG